MSIRQKMVLTQISGVEYETRGRRDRVSAGGTHQSGWGGVVTIEALKLC